ncbi:MAG: hypothetical protein ACI4I3_10320 [Acutalibacteraceae bacterium]
MKSSNYYLKALESQCRSVTKQNKAENSDKVFNDICIRLTDDFLPPIDREDIAELSFILLNIENAASSFNNSLSGGISVKNLLNTQLNGLFNIIEGLIKKKKTCGEEIRRLIAVNNKCEIELRRKSNIENALNLNNALKEFLKCANRSFFKNL